MPYSFAQSLASNIPIGTRSNPVLLTWNTP